MNTIITQKQIGQRIAELRKLKGKSQEVLAKSIKLSRPSLAQIELGNRSVDILEMQKLAMVLGFSLDDFMSVNFNSNKYSDTKEVDGRENLPSAKTEERISVPTLNMKKFKNVLLYILERCGGKPNVGEASLYKLLYFSDFNHYELYEEHLTGATYRKLPNGPVPQMIDSIINEMITQGKIQRVETEYHGYPQTRYLPLEKADLTVFMASEIDLVDGVIEQMGDWNASSISDYSQGDLPWEVTEEGKFISYNLAFYREMPYSVRVYEDSETVIL